MADAINRIVPPSVSLDRATQTGREGKGKDNSDARRKRRNKPIETAKPEDQKTDDDLTVAEAEKTKGKKLDVSA